MQTLERVQGYVAETIRVCTRFHVHDFSMFRNIDDTYQMLEQLANFAAKKYFVMSKKRAKDLKLLKSRLLSEKGAFREEDFFPIVTK